MRRDDLRTAHQLLEIGRARHLTGVRAQVVKARLERTVGAEQRLRRHRGGYIGRPKQQLGVGARQREHAQHAVSAVDQRQAFFGLELDGFEPGRLERLRRRPARALSIDNVAFTHEREADMRERRQIAAATDRTVSRHHRRNARVQHGDQAFREQGADPGHSHCQRAGAQQHGRPDHLAIDRRTDSGGVGADQG